MALTKITNSMIDGAFVNVRDFGATGDGSTNDTLAIQAAISSLSATGGTVYFPKGTYKVSRNVGTNDRWGIKIPYSNITLLGDNASLERYNSDISTYALAYPLLFVGVTDSNSSPISNITVEGITFVGNDTRHTFSGNSIADNRTAIVIRNTSNLTITNNKFYSIDSSAIWFMCPVEYDYVNSVYFNTTKSRIAQISNCEFYAVSHSTAGRALIHAIVCRGVDHLTVTDNYFSYCDDCIAGETSYDGPLSLESDTYAPGVAGWTLGNVMRTGRDWVFANNKIENSSEHAVYVAGVDVVVADNIFNWTNTTLGRAADPIKIRSRNCAVTGNVMSNCGAGISINEPSFLVTVSGNTMSILGAANTGGAIDVNSDGLSTYISNRSAYMTNYYPMTGIAITGNTVLFEEASTAFQAHIGLRVYTNDVDVNYPNGQIQGITVSGNTFQNHKYGIYIVNSEFRGMVVEGNTFMAKPFTASGFNASTTLNTQAILMCAQGGAGTTLTSLQRMRFDGNYCYGATYLMRTDTGSGSADTYDAPWGMSNNRFEYIKNIKTADIKPFQTYNSFTGNVGSYFLDRTWGGQSLGNSLGDGPTSNSYYRYTLQWTGSNVRFYTDDAGSFVNLN